jgi:DNA polymerase elongation subunit (family B)
MKNLKILVLDIETGPSLAYIWSLWDKHVPIQRIVENGTTLCWAAKWVDDEAVYTGSLDKHSELESMLRLKSLMDDADCIVHYNGKKFDIPIINRDMLRLGILPPSPHKDIDLLETVKRRFRFISNKLDYVAQYLGLGEKTKHAGFEMWVGCMKNDPESWRMMKTYNIQDVRLTEQVYKKLLPWLDRHPSHGNVTNELVCPKCGSDDFLRKGFALTNTQKYQRYLCRGCGGWFRGHKTVHLPLAEKAVNAA